MGGAATSFTVLALPPRLVPRWCWEITCTPLEIDDGTEVVRVDWKSPTVVPLVSDHAVLTLSFDGGLQWIPCRRVRLRGDQVAGQVVTYRARWLNFLRRPGISISAQSSSAAA